MAVDRQFVSFDWLSGVIKSNSRAGETDSINKKTKFNVIHVVATHNVDLFR